MLELRCSNTLCSYRGYGRSQGQPCEAGIKLDAQAALDHLLERKDVNRDLVSSTGMVALSICVWCQSICTCKTYTAPAI